MLELTFSIAGLLVCTGYSAFLLLRRKSSLFANDDLVIGALLGFVAYTVVFGFSILDITNIEWTLKGDTATHVLGLHFFRNEPWSLPIGAIRNYAYPFGTSLLAVEGYPFVLLVKLFNGWFPKEPLQFHGIWIMICCVLQGVAAMLLLRRTGWPMAARILGTTLFVISPIMLFRAEAQHISLMSHFLILFALNLMLEQTVTRKGMFAWAALFLLALWVHMYLLTMSWLLLCAFLYRQVALLRSCSIPQAAMLSVVSLLPAVALFFALQPVTPSSGYHTGFGIFALNLNAPINPLGGWSSRDWSRLLAERPVGPGHYEGFGYLGAGIILMLAALTIPAWKTVFRREWLGENYWLVLLCCALTFYALSNVISVGNLTLISYPNIYGPLSEIFRASGRFFWPVWYLILFGALMLLSRMESRKAAFALLICATLVQVYDLSGKLTQYAEKYRKETNGRTPLQSSKWNALMGHYSRLSVMISPAESDSFIPFALLAASHGKQINIGFFARYPQEMLLQAQREHADLALGKYRPDTLYIVTEVIAGALAQRKQDMDLLARIDNLVVFAPGFLSSRSASGHPELRSDNDFGIPLENGREISFTSAASRTYAGIGWSNAEKWGTWSDGDEAFLNFSYREKPQHDVTIEITFNVFSAGSHQQQDIQVFANGAPVGEWHLDASADRMPWTKELIIPASLLQSGHLELKFRIANPMSPTRLGLSPDDRRLGIGLIRLKVASH